MKQNQLTAVSLNTEQMKNTKGGKRTAVLAPSDFCKVMVSNPNAKLVGITPGGACVEW